MVESFRPTKDGLVFLSCVPRRVCSLYPTLCDSVDCSLQGSSVHGIFQAKILEWVAFYNSRGSSQPGTEPTSLVFPALAGRFFVTAPPGKPFSFLLDYRLHLCLFTVVSQYLPYNESSSIFWINVEVFELVSQGLTYQFFKHCLITFHGILIK